MKALIDEYLHWARVRGCCEGTLSMYGCALRLFARDSGVSRPEEVTRQLVMAWLSRQKKEGRANCTIRQKLTILKGFLDYFVELGRLNRNPVHGMPRIRSARKPRVPLTGGQVEDMLAAARKRGGLRSLRDYAIIEVMYSTGARVSELQSLNVEDLNLEAGTANIIGKGKKQRAIFLGSRAVSALRSYLASHRRLGGCRAVFIDLNATGRLSLNRLRDIIVFYGRAAGLERRVTPHLLRHTFSAHMLENGCGLPELQDLLGHACLNTTRIYIHIANTKLRDTFKNCHPRA